MSKRRLRAVAALAALVALSAAAPASAGILASGYLSSSNAVRLGCRVLNVGSTGVKIVSAKVIQPPGIAWDDYDECKGTLLPGAACTVTAPGSVLAGIVTVEGPTKFLRGECVLLAAGNVVIASTPMR